MRLTGSYMYCYLVLNPHLQDHYDLVSFHYLVLLWWYYLCSAGFECLYLYTYTIMYITSILYTSDFISRAAT